MLDYLVSREDILSPGHLSPVAVCPSIKVLSEPLPKRWEAEWSFLAVSCIAWLCAEERFLEDF